MNFDEMVESTETRAPARRALELRKRPEYIVGGLPTVSLLPQELKAAARDKTIRRAFVGAVVVALVIAGGATAGATALSGAAQSRLDAANARTTALSAQLAKFSDVQALQQSISLGEAAVKVGSSTEIDWQAQMNAIEADMPAGYTVMSILTASANPLVDYPQTATPLNNPSAATVGLTVTTQSIAELPIWLRKLRSIPAYADATTSVASGDAAGYTVVLTVHLSPKAIIDVKAAK